MIIFLFQELDVKESLLENKLPIERPLPGEGELCEQDIWNCDANITPFS